MKTSWLKRKQLKKLDTKSHSKKIGLPPGSLVYIGNRESEKHLVSLINYTEKAIEEIEIKSVEDYSKYLGGEQNSWINFDGIFHVDKVGEIGAVFGLHVLLLEDMLNTNQRPKMELLDDHVFLTLKMLKLKDSDEGKVIDQEQVSFVLGRNWLLSFQEEEGDVFEVIRKRIQNPLSVMRKNEIDYLFYRLVDTVVDNYYIIAEYLSESIEELEEEIMENPSDITRWKMQATRKEILQLRKAVMPLREAIGRLAKEENEFVKKSTVRYFHDVYEHIVQLNDFIESVRDQLASLVDLYLSGVSNKMNQIMKVLTIIATIFIPLTFVAGIYGMNFDNMPELHWKNGYYGVWMVMFVMLIGMLYYFKKKDWL